MRLFSNGFVTHPAKVVHETANFKASFIGGFFVPGVQGTARVRPLASHCQAFIFTQPIESKGIVALGYRLTFNGQLAKYPA